jgi:hypothetical protein
MKKPKKPNGFVLWEGVSQLDGKTPIVAILILKSENVKTGRMNQLYILRKDMLPSLAFRLGLDGGTCGTCAHSGSQEKSCYVNLGQGPNTIWRSYKSGGYPEGDIREITKPVRLGAYGDPAALPFWLVELICCFAALRFGKKSHTGYTHAWKTCDKKFSLYLMASVDSPQERSEAKSSGWRTFRVRTKDQTVGEREIRCPSDRVQCLNCTLCDGSAEKADITIELHGLSHKVKRGEAYINRISLL